MEISFEKFRYDYNFYTIIRKHLYVELIRYRDEGQNQNPGSIFLPWKHGYIIGRLEIAKIFLWAFQLHMDSYVIPPMTCEMTGV